MKHVALGLGAGLLTVALAAGCSSVTSGTVTGKQHDASYTYYVQQCMVYGKYGCTMYVPMPYTEPECWELDLTSSNGDTGSVCVDEKTFDDAKVGSNYP